MGQASTSASLASLEGLQRQLRKASSPQFVAKLGQVLGAAALKQLADGFKQSRTPYGERWRPLKYRRGKPLLDTGRMAASAAIHPRPNGFELTITANYSSYHQLGTRRIPKRQMLPDASRGLGPTWKAALVKQARDFVTQELKGGK